MILNNFLEGLWNVFIYYIESYLIFKNINKILHVLLKIADLNKKDVRGMTPLLKAASIGNKNVVRELLENGADPYILGPDGESALERAEFYKNNDAYKIIKGFME